MKQPKLYEKMVHSMAPAVYGHEEVKRGVSCYSNSFQQVRL